MEMQMQMQMQKCISCRKAELLLCVEVEEIRVWIVESSLSEAHCVLMNMNYYSMIQYSTSTHLQISLVLPPAPAAVQPTKHECRLPGSHLRPGGAQLAALASHTVTE
eukprot:scaffold15279_cov146-Skeletonema_marinoi.AAC.1